MLKLKQKQTLEHLDNVIRALFADEASGHDYYHVKRVVNLTTRFLYSGVNEFVALAIAYLHDVFDDKVHKVDNLDLALKDFFETHQLDFHPHVDAIILGVSQIGYKGGFGVVNKTPEATLVSDADLIESMGAIGIARTFYYAGSKNTPLFLEGDFNRTIDSLADYRKESPHALAHFDEKLLKLVDLIVTDKAKVIARHRHQTLVQFYEAFYQEMEESSPISES